MDASIVSQMKTMEEENRRLKRMYAVLSMQAELLKDAAWKKVIRPVLRRGLSENAVARHGVSIEILNFSI